ncbi:hypothetical protein RYH80_18205 [Halobaculum sp. MBLA0147]|uniref:hypothetical protein n=1 Tax=Halobaculum sp. MBLA0147 TaxID=3079934 RepID=UPI00352544E3
MSTLTGSRPTALNCRESIFRVTLAVAAAETALEAMHEELPNWEVDVDESSTPQVELTKQTVARSQAQALHRVHEALDAQMEVGAEAGAEYVVTGVKVIAVSGPVAKQEDDYRNSLDISE